jgi:RNA polymerase sigma-70 factor (ECF subfamily)
MRSTCRTRPGFVRPLSANPSRIDARPRKEPHPTGEPAPTRIALLAQLKDGEGADAWREFVHLYGPVVYGFARKRGLGDTDAANLMQDVLRCVGRNTETVEYDPEQGTLRGWLYTLTRNKIDQFFNNHRDHPRASGEAAARERLSADRDAWELECERRLSSRAVALIKGAFPPNVWNAFWGTVIEGRAAEEVGDELKMPPGAVYVARSRVLVRLRDEIQRLRAGAEGR